MKRKALLIYPDPPGHSGQRRASELFSQLFEDVFQFRHLRIPGLPRTDVSPVLLLAWPFQLLAVYARAVIEGFRRHEIVFFNLSQSRFGLTRDLLIVEGLRLGARRTPVVGSLHGNLFSEWEAGDRSTRLFLRVLRHFSVVTVLGPSQQEKLLSLGVAPEKVRVLPNTCEIEAISADEIDRKHRDAPSPIGLLHLSSLIESKGYVSLMEALPLVSAEVSAVLCGGLASSPWDLRFADLKTAGDWLNQQAEKTGALWIRGAVGGKKRKLFEEARIFVFPSQYPVEAQPLVLLEAMASGCAIVTTRTGEIPHMLDEECAVILDEVTPASIAAAIDQLAASPELRIRLARNARERFVQRFSMEVHRQNWQSMLDKLEASGAAGA